MTELVPSSAKDLVFDQKEILPYGTLGHFIDWNKVFRDKIGTFYPKPINWHTSLNEHGELDTHTFLWARTWYNEKRKSYMESITNVLRIIERDTKRSPLPEWYYIESIIDKTIRAFEEMHILGGKREGVYKQPFYFQMKELSTQLESQMLLADDTQTKELLHQIQRYIENSLKREDKEWELCRSEYQEANSPIVKKYIKEDGFLNVDQVIVDLKGGRSWNEEIMLAAFFTAQCTKEDLIKLQSWAIEALNDHVKRLDTHKVFTIIDWVLPYINDEFKIDCNLPEIFRPEYLNHISIRNLDIQGFSAQVRAKAEKLQWSIELQDKLIEQFKEFGTSKEGYIGFGQGSEQLWYWNGVTSGVTKDNFKHYLKDTNLWEEKMPTPRILMRDYESTTKEDLIKSLT